MQVWGHTVQVGGVAVTFLVGLALGITGTVLGPSLIEPYLPSAIRGDLEGIEGAVMSKQRKGDRLLLTVQTPDGTILATFKKKITEIDLLVAEGDMLTLARTGYRAFMEDPPNWTGKKTKSQATAKARKALAFRHHGKEYERAGFTVNVCRRHNRENGLGCGQD